MFWLCVQKAYRSYRRSKTPLMSQIRLWRRHCAPTSIISCSVTHYRRQQHHKTTSKVPGWICMLLSVSSCVLSWVEERTWQQAPTANQLRKRAKDTASWCAPASIEEVFNYCHSGKLYTDVYSPFGFVPTSRRWNTHWQLSQSIQKKRKTAESEGEGGVAFS